MNDPNRIQAVFLLAVEATDAAARAQILERECSADMGLRQRVEALLQAHDASAGFLDKPLVAGVSTVDEAPRIEGPGTRIGSYKLLQLLGQGGMGVVFMAEQTEPVVRKVALKVIKPGMDTHQVVARFEAERQALALMDHPNIAKVFDGGATASGRPYFVMELVKGMRITQYCDELRLTPRQRLELFAPVCQAVQHAHQKGIIHRDLKPSNVLIAQYDGRPVPKVIDFGVAKATGQKLTEKTLFTDLGAVVGTLEYMSPEQAELNQLDIDTRSDIYALGVLLYELLTGSTPLERKQLRAAAFVESLRIIREVEPPKPSLRLSTTDELPALAAKRGLEPKKLSGLIRGDLDWIVMKCLEKDRNRRYETANGLAMDVQRYLADEPVVAGPPSAIYRLREFARRHKAKLLAAAATVVVLLVASLGVSWTLWDRSARHTDTERAVSVALAKAEQLRDRAATMPTTTSQQAEAVLTVWRQADAALAKGEAALTTGIAGSGLRKRVSDVRQDVEQGRQLAEARRARAVRKEKLFHDLEEARMASSQWVDIDHRYPILNIPGQFTLSGYPEIRYDYANSFKEFAVTFAGFSLNVAEDGAEPMARRIAAEEEDVQEALLTALDDWAFAAAKLPQAAPSAQDLRALAQAVDTDKWRKRFRAAVVAGDLAAQKDLSIEAQQLSLPASSLRLAAMNLDALGERKLASDLLLWGRDRHPKDFWLVFELARIVGDPKAGSLDLNEKIRYYRAAVALRPAASAAHNNLGHTLAAQGVVADAVAELRQAIERDPKNGNAHDNLGGALLADNKLGDAVAALRQAVVADPNNANAHNTLGKALAANNQLDDAIAAFRKAHELDPMFEQAHCALGDYLAVKHGPDDTNLQLEAAVAEYRIAVDLDPKYAKAYCKLGRILRLMHKFEDAVVAERKAIALAQDYAEAYCELGLALEKQGRYAAALDALQRGQALGKKLGPSWFYPYVDVEKVKRLMKLEERVPAIVKGTDRVAPGEFVDFVELCRCQQRNAAGAKVCAATFAANPSMLERPMPYLDSAARFAALASVGKGIDADKLDDKERAALRRQALAWLRVILAFWIKEQAVDRYVGGPRGGPRGDWKQWQDDADLAGIRDQDAVAKLPADERESWQKLWADMAAVLKEADDTRDALQRVGNAQRKQNAGHLDEAIAEYRKAIALSSKFARFHFQLAMALQENNELDGAIAKFRTAIEQWSGMAPPEPHLNPKIHEPELAHANEQLGLALCAMDPLSDDGIASLRKAAQSPPPIPHKNYYLACALRNKHQPEEAIKEFQIAIEREPQFRLAHTYLGLTLQDQGKFAEANAEFNQAVKIEPKLADVLSGKVRLSDSRQRLDLIEMCRLQRQHAAAVRLYEDAFVDDRKLAENTNAAHRYHAACSAVLAAAGQAIDADKLADKDRSRLRNKALEWLRADLAYWTKQLASDKPNDRAATQQTMQRWQDDPDLVAVRDKDGLAKLPAEERAAWEKLWAEVAEVLKKASEAK